MADAKISALPASTTPLAGSETLPVVQSGVTKKVSVANLTAGRAVSMLSATSVGANTYNVISNTGGPGSNATPSFAGTQYLGDATRLIAQTDGGDCSNSSFRGVYRIRTCDDGSATMNTRMQFNGSTDIIWSTVNLVQGTAAKGVNFTANTPAAGMTSQLLNWYEEGTWTPVYKSSGGAFTTMTMDVLAARYTRVGRQVTVTCAIRTDNVDATGASGVVYIDGLPFTAASGNAGTSAASASQVFGFNTNNPNGGFVQTNTKFIYLEYRTTANGVATELPVAALTTGAVANQNNLVLTATYSI